MLVFTPKYSAPITVLCPSKSPCREDFHKWRIPLLQCTKRNSPYRKYGSSHFVSAPSAASISESLSATWSKIRFKQKTKTLTGTWVFLYVTKEHETYDCQTEKQQYHFMAQQSHEIYFLKVKTSVVFYKGHSKCSCAQLSTMMSFTIYPKGHTILIGPERASRSLQSSDHKLVCDQNPGGSP